jgi:hypothetical protein
MMTKICSSRRISNPGIPISERPQIHALYCPAAFNCLLYGVSGDRFCGMIFSHLAKSHDVLVAMQKPPPKINQLFKLSATAHCKVELFISKCNV